MKEITVDAVAANIDKVTEFADDILDSYGCPVKVRMQIDIAIDEILSNIAYYAYGEQGGKVTVGFQIQDNPKMVCVTFSDKGIPYNPLEKEDPDIKMITLMEYPIKLVVNQKDVLGKMKQLHPEDLMSKPGISYTEGSAMDREINEFFKEQEITPDIHYRTSSEEIQNFVACGLGWAFIAQNGTPMKKGLKILEMPEMTLKRETCLAMRKDRQLSKNAQNFLKFTLSYNENFL